MELIFLKANITYNYFSTNISVKFNRPYNSWTFTVKEINSFEFMYHPPSQRKNRGISNLKIKLESG